MKPKHLVLDADVYLKLKKRKRQVGMTAQEIGNSILRSVLARPLLTDVVGKHLVKLGKITSETYEKILTEAVKEFQGLPNPFDSLIQITPNKTLTIGSWEVLEIYRARDGTFQILSARVKDTKKNATSPHYHDQNEINVVISGILKVEMDAEEYILHPLDSISIPAGQPHNATPLTDETLVIVINKPPWPDYISKMES